jgi:crotonobetainyl-CoA:carnitine CoA-transferase CaiB-like acyl-CoA transferase
VVEAILKKLTQQDIIERCQAAGMPFMPIARPNVLFDDAQLNQAGGGRLPRR